MESLQNQNLISITNSLQPLQYFNISNLMKIVSFNWTTKSNKEFLFWGFLDGQYLAYSALSTKSERFNISNLIINLFLPCVLHKLIKTSHFDYFEQAKFLTSSAYWFNTKSNMLSYKITTAFLLRVFLCYRLVRLLQESGWGLSNHNWLQLKFPVKNPK